MDAAEDLGTIQADTRKVKQIVYNLLSNAVKFTGESGHVTLHAGRVHEVLNATDAEAGLTLAREKQPDLILMDIQLPGRDGLAATALLKKDDATRAIPVIALTALAMKGDEERIRAAGCDGIRPCRRLVVRHVGARVHLRARGSGPMATR